MSIKDIIGLEEPLKKLVETVSEGVGVVSNHLFEFDVARIKRVGKAEAEVEKEKIIGQAEAKWAAREIINRAEKRFMLEQYNKQINLENIIFLSKENLVGKSVSSEPVEKDWTMRFLDIAQNTSRENMQDMLARILSGEIQKPGTYSYQTLEIIKYLSKRDLEKFVKFIAISTGVGVIKLHGNSKESLEKYSLTFQDYLDLSSVGLFNQSSTLTFDVDLPSGTEIIFIVGHESYLVSNKNQQGNTKIDFGLYVFSNSGKELRELLLDYAKNEKSDLFKNNFIEEIKKRGFDINIIQS